MKLCGWCEKRIWWWQHFAFKTTHHGQTRYHVRCYQYINQINAQSQQQYSGGGTGGQYIGGGGYSYEDFLARLEDEDGGW